MRRAHKDTRMNNCGYREGFIENAYVQGPEFETETWMHLSFIITFVAQQQSSLANVLTLFIFFIIN